MLGLRKSTAAEESGTTTRIEDLIAAGQIAYVRYDSDGRTVEVGGDFESIAAYKQPEIGVPMTDVIGLLELTDLAGNSLGDVQTVQAGIQSVFDAKEETTFETMLKRADGGTVSLNTYFPGDGSALTVLRDVTDIARDRAMLEFAVKTAGAGYWSIDLQTGKFTFSDTVMDRLGDAERARIADKGLFAIIHKEDVARMAMQWQDIVNGVGGFDMTYRVVTEAEGVMWQRSIGTIETLRDGTRVRATAFVIDITQDIKNRAELEEAQDVAKSKEDFLARMSHEIRTPLNAIIGMADSLQDEDMTDVVRDVVKDIETSAENLNELLSHTLNHAKLDSGAVVAVLEPINPRDVISGCARTWRAKVEAKGLTLRMGVSPDLPETLPLDSFRVRQCLDNLVSNAVKFTETGQIVLAAKEIAHEGQPHLALIVQDSGIGMNAEEQQSIFNAYTQADGSISRKYGGTGLGLSICRQLATLMGGTLSVRSQPGRGSAFILLLPFAADEAHASAPANVDTPAAVMANVPREDGRMPFEGLSVLCVEDNPINQKVVERLIGSRVEQLHFAGHGREALAILNTVHIDVVLMDIHMPVMDGIETTLEIRKSGTTYANVIIIALTADPDYQQMRICRNIGMNDTIAKPVRREDILESFNRTLGSLSQTHGVKVAIG